MGYTNFEASFDIQGEYPIKVEAWVSARDRCRFNKVGMYFLSKTTKSIDFSPYKLEFKIYPGIAVSINNKRSKIYSNFSFYKIVRLDHSLIIDPNSRQFVSLEPQNLVFRKGTSFKLDKTFEQKGTYTYNTYYLREEKCIRIMFNNPTGSKIEKPK